MILQRLRLSNFRQYRGTHELSFALESTKNVTIVTGVNGAGKTGLFYALNWVLYGDAGIPGALINKRATQEDKPAKAFVELHFLHEGQRFVARREQVHAAGTEHEESYSVDVLESGGRTKAVPNPSQRTNVILPKDARKYFFFDGERIDELSRPDHADQVREAIRSVLKLKVLERTAQHLREASKEFGKLLRETQLDAEQGRLLEAIEGLQAAAESAEREIVNLKSSEADTTLQLATVRNKLDRLVEAKAIRDEEESVLALLAPLRLEATHTEDRLRDAVGRAGPVVAIKAVGLARRILDDKRARGEVPAGVRQQLIEDLLREDRCICGRSLDTAARAALVDRHKNTTSAAVAESVAAAAAELRGTEVRAEQLLHEIHAASARRAQIQDDLMDGERRLEGIRSRLIGGAFTEDLTRLAQTRIALDNRLVDHRADVKTRERELDDARREIVRASERLAALQAKTAEGKTAKDRYELSLRSAEAADQLTHRFGADMRLRVQEATDEIFRTIVWKREQFSRVTVTEDYRLEVTDRFGTSALAGLSAGERQVLSLSFIAGMSRVTDEEAPLVIDTPFGRLSEAPVTSIVRELPEIAKQLVLLVTDREIDPDAAAMLRPRVGREYRLVFDDSKGETSIEAVL